MLDWKPYINDRIIAEHPSGFFIIKPADIELDAQPIFCPLCDAMMITSYDEDNYRKFKCCENCANRFVYPNRDKWEEGWRPTKEDILHKLRENA